MVVSNGGRGQVGSQSVHKDVRGGDRAYNDLEFTFICLFVCNRGDTVQYHSGLRSRELGQAPMLQVFLTPSQALSLHLRQQMV